MSKPIKIEDIKSINVCLNFVGKSSITSSDGNDSYKIEFNQVFSCIKDLLRQYEWITGCSCYRNNEKNINVTLKDG